jgi:hypothetical protein
MCLSCPRIHYILSRASRVPLCLKTHVQRTTRDAVHVCRTRAAAANVRHKQGKMSWVQGNTGGRNAEVRNQADAWTAKLSLLMLRTLMVWKGGRVLGGASMAIF